MDWIIPADSNSDDRADSGGGASLSIGYFLAPLTRGAWKSFAWYCCKRDGFPRPRE